MKDRERVIAEITLSHLIRLCSERGYPVSREQALAFLNQKQAYEMWKHMMQAAEDFIGCSLLRQYLKKQDPVGGNVGKVCQRSPGDLELSSKT